MKNNKLRAPDVDVEYTGDHPITDLEKILNIDELLHEGETIFVLPLIGGLEHMKGVFRVVDAHRGDRTFVEITNNFDFGEGWSYLNQEYLGVNYNIYRINQEESPEYFL